MTSPARRNTPLIDVQDDRLTVNLKRIPWEVVLSELQRQITVPFHVQGRLEGTATAVFEALPLEQGMRRLLRHTSFIFLYRPATADHAGRPRLAEVWILPHEEGTLSDLVQAPDLGAPAMGDAVELALTQALVAETGEERQQAMRALTESRDPRIREAFIQALQDADPQVRERAAYSLAVFNDEAAIPHLSQAVLDDKDEAVREMAADALGWIAKPQALPVLVQALADKSANVRWSAADALGMIGGPQAITALQPVLRDEDTEVRKRAVQVLRYLTQRSP